MDPSVACSQGGAEGVGRIELDDIVGVDKGSWRCSKKAAAIVKGLPSEETMVVGYLYDFLLTPKESRFSFSVYQRHVNAKDSQKAIGAILDPRCFSLRSP